MAKQKEVKTNAMRILESLKIPYTHHTYECEEFVDGLQIADKLSLPYEQVYKTLVTVGSSKNYFVFVIPIAEELDTGFSLWLTARLDGAFAGYVGAQLVPPEADMMNLAVVPELRRRGTAQALLQALQERLAARGIGSLTLEARASNLPAQRLYTAAGFACIGRRPNYYLAPREDALILRKELDHADPCH